ncbi:NAD(P)H-dependent oxidoreductase [Celeribacter indicus]|uniref:NAD(P)H dehydrogenase (Quinone) n=1 Tax=Celeribacter indicus TaxID=1208324 RepID=A0A0B5E311_9RHOB|nr:NAD(P)H-dependent oxidoreductase [Celeribacter indicus]AJE47770.1 NAD(P)H dehydrogenase (quinone) [Celeribacter indicus]SDW22319.1 Putative NADPH-quinone reductase (modulator of drug activity B) [Celeribacter indicus]
MERALVVYCHPQEGSFNAAIRDLVVAELSRAGIAYRLRDLYADGFDPVMSARELAQYYQIPENRAPVQRDCDDILWCDSLIFVYPTWWYGLPALLKGWLDRTLLPDVAFIMPRTDGENILPGLTHITKLGVYTTCGASWWLTRFIGAPGRRTLMRGLRLILARKCKTSFAAHYLMDSSTPDSRRKHLGTVRRRLRKLIETPAPLAG